MASSPSSVSTGPVRLSDIDQTLLDGLDLPRLLEFLKDVAMVAGTMILVADPSVETSDTKANTSDRVTETDKAVEAHVQETCASYYPEINFLGEETFKTGDKLDDKPTFVCDPIDGTLNFTHGVPNIAVCLALCVQKRPIIGVVYNPFRGDLFYAIKGQGAFLGKTDGRVELSRQPLPLKQKPAPLKDLNDCLCCIEWGNKRFGNNWAIRTHMFKTLMTDKTEGGKMIHSCRSFGSAALDFCYVAAGYIDLFWEGGCWIWDVAAGWAILEEAGGIVASANPGDWNPSLEGRVYLAVRPAPEKQKEVVEELWDIMGDSKFEY